MVVSDYGFDGLFNTLNLEVMNMKFYWDQALKIWQENAPKDYAEQMQLYHQGVQWFHNHPVTINTFAFPSSDQIHFMLYSLQQANEGGWIGHALKNFGLQ